MSELNQELSVLLGKMNFEDDDEEEDELVKEYSEASDAWFRSTMEAISIINEMAHDTIVMDSAMERLINAASKPGHVCALLTAIRLVNKASKSPEEFTESFARICRNDMTE